MVPSYGADQLVNLLVRQKDVTHGEGSDFILLGTLLLEEYPIARDQVHIAILEVLNNDLFCCGAGAIVFGRQFRLLYRFREVDSEGDAGVDRAKDLLDVIELVLDLLVLLDALLSADVAEGEHEEDGPDHVDVAVPDADRLQLRIEPDFYIDHLVDHGD